MLFNRACDFRGLHRVLGREGDHPEQRHGSSSFPHRRFGAYSFRGGGPKPPASGA
jgi:hypothetical protein